MAGLRKRSEVGGGAGSGTRVPPPVEKSASVCALSVGKAESSCQVCVRIGGCPDREKYEQRAGEESVARAADSSVGDPIKFSPRAVAGEDPGDDATASPVGSVVEATWGEELFQPAQYNTFRVGPFKAFTAVRRGESIAGALARLHAEIAEAAEKIREQKAADYLRALRAVQQ